MKVSNILILFAVLFSKVVSGQTNLSVEYTVTLPSLYNIESGQVKLHISGGFQPYTVEWCGRYLDDTIINDLAAGRYKVIVKDSIDNIAVRNIVVSEEFVWDSTYPLVTANRLVTGNSGWFEFEAVSDTGEYLIGYSFEETLDSGEVNVGFFVKEDSFFVKVDTSIIQIPSFCLYEPGYSFSIKKEYNYYDFFVNGLKVYSTQSNTELLISSAASRIMIRPVTNLSLWTFDFNPYITKLRSNLRDLRSDYFYSYKCTDELNWIYSEVYDGNDIPVSANIQYYDDLSRLIQTQYMNVVANKVFAVETRYDEYGRKVLTTLPAPTKYSPQFCYEPKFISTDITDMLGTVNYEYSWDHFDSRTANTVYNPRPVSQNTFGELGWYYSNNNTMETRTPASQYPYSRIEYYNQPINAVKAVSGVGDHLKLGSGHEIKMVTMPVAGELSFVYGLRDNLDKIKYSPFPGECIDEDIWQEACNRKVYDEFNVMKTISIDQHGVERIDFISTDGNKLASCYSGQVNGANVHTQKVFTVIPPGEFRDIHIPAGCESSFSLKSIVKLNGNFVEESFFCDDMKFDIYNIDNNFSPISINASPDEYEESFLMPGYYRIVNRQPVTSSAHSTCFLKINYELNYHGFSLSYYDLANRLVAVVPPEGVSYDDPQVFVQNGNICSAVSDIEDGTINTNTGGNYPAEFFPYNFNIDFEFDNIPLTPEDATQVSYFDIALSHDCSVNTGGGTIGIGGPLGGNLAVTALFADELPFPQVRFSNSLRNIRNYTNVSFQNRTNIPFAARDNIKRAAEQESENDYVVGTINKYVFEMEAIAGPDDEELITPPAGIALVYMKPHYNAAISPTHDLYGVVAKPYYGDFHYTLTEDGMSSSSEDLPIGNLDIELNQKLSCTKSKVRFRLLNIRKEKYVLLRATRGNPLNGEPQLYEYLGYMMSSDYVKSPTTENDLNDVRLVATRNTRADQTVAQQSQVISYHYNSASDKLWQVNADEGRKDCYYRKDGLMRFSQNAKQRETYKFSYVNYDEIGRIREFGEYDPSVGASEDPEENINNEDAFYFKPYLCEDVSWQLPGINKCSDIIEELDNLPDNQCLDVIRYTYDERDNISGLNPILSTRQQRYVVGRLSKVERLHNGDDNNAYSIIWYSYNEQQRIEWEVHYIAGLGYKTVDYQYDFNGNIISTSYQKDMAAEKFVHAYTYNKAKQLTLVRTIDENSVTVTQAKYSYYLHGSLKREEINGNLQGVDYTYTISGALKAINNANLDDTDPGKDSYSGINSSFSHDFFGMELDYHANDYSRAGTDFSDGIFDNNGDHIADNIYPDQFNGNIKSVRWKTRDVDLVDLDVPDLGSFAGYQNMYGFKYDKIHNWMLSAELGSYTPNGMTIGGQAGPYLYETGKYSEKDLTYSLNGNILTMKRSAQTSAGIDNLGYHYDATLTNRLLYIDDAAGTTGITTDLEDQASGNYEYNAIGEMVKDNSTQDDHAVDYDRSGKVIAVWTADRTKKKVTYDYDANGYRVRKTLYSTGIGNFAIGYTYYVNNMAGKAMRIIEKSTLSSTEGPPTDEHYETPIYGLGRIGIKYSNYVFDEVNTPIIGYDGDDPIYDYENAAMVQVSIATEYQLVDHLGNVRVTFIRNSSDVAEIVGYADYYPTGMIMPDRQLVSSNGYRYGYQGEFAEKAGETGWNDFEWRAYDARTGRWMSIDKAKQHWSPYLAMGNIWILHVDKDGQIDGYIVVKSIFGIIGGGAEIAAGVTVTGTGVGAVGGVPLMVDGGVRITSNFLVLVSELSGDDQFRYNMRQLPQNLGQIAGMGIDKMTGNKNDVAKNTLGILNDFITLAATGGSILTMSNFFKSTDAMGKFERVVHFTEETVALMENYFGLFDNAYSLTMNDEIIADEIVTLYGVRYHARRIMTYDRVVFEEYEYLGLEGQE